MQHTLAPTMSPYLSIVLLSIFNAPMPSSFCAVSLKVGVGKVPLELISKP